MATKTKPCTLGPKHKWTWVKNVSVSSATISSRGTTCRSSLRGKYRCQCGEIKYGAPDHNGGDLRTLGPMAGILSRAGEKK